MADFHFHHDSAVFLPDFKPDEQKDQQSGEVKFRGLAALRACYLRAGTHPEEAILITGHTDTSGAPAYNVKLSEKRAEAVLHVLNGNRQAWVAIADGKHKVEDYKLILKWTAKVRGWASDPGEVNGSHDAATTAALREFQRSYNRDFAKSIAVDGAIGPETWGAFFDVYMEALGNLLETDRNGLGPHRSALRFIATGPAAVGCGENFPIEAADKDGFKSETNRRVEILFFRAEQSPVPDCHKGAGTCAPLECPIYKFKQFKFEPIPSVPKPGQTVDPIITLDAPTPAPAPGVFPSSPPPPGSKPAPAPAPPAASKPAPTPAPAPGVTPPSPPPPQTANPILTATDRIVLVKKSYTKAGRKPFKLKTSAPFDGSGTLTLSKPGISFFTAATGGALITFNGTDNVFTGAKVTAGVTVFAEGVSPSAAMDDFVLTLTLSGGSFKVGPPATLKLTCLDVILDICESRKAAGIPGTTLASPPVANNKIDTGRFIHLQDPGGRQGRAQMIVRKTNPAAFTGKLVLKSFNAKVQAFPNEFPTVGESPVPEEIDNASIPGGGLNVFVQGAQVSGSLRDTGFTLGVKDLEPEGDKVCITIVRLKNLKAEVPSTPARTGRAGSPGNSPVPKHDFTRATGANLAAQECSVDFVTNPPLVLVEGSVLVADPVKLSVEVEPAGVPVLWSVLRDTRPAPYGDNANIVALSPKPAPTRVENGLNATLLTDAVGSFHIRPFVDCNGSAQFDEKPDIEPFIVMNLVLVRVSFFRDNSVARSANMVAIPTGGGGIRLQPGPFNVNAPAGDEMFMGVEADLVGGGGDGRRGCDAVFAGWVNTMPGGQNVIGTYNDTGVTPSQVRTSKLVFVSNTAAIGGPGRTFVQDPPNPVPILLSPDFLDTGRAGKGSGGDTACLSQSRIKSRTNLPVGSRLIIEAVDSPSLGVPGTHARFPTAKLTQYHFELHFRAFLCFWTGSQGAGPDAANRLYSVLRQVDWNMLGEWTIDAAGAITTVTAPNVNISGSTTFNPTVAAIATPVETRPPTALDSVAFDARI
ncbi:MAG TPA: OmpA family protein [Fibrobacteria bacterium]|nr:OmpA family protein [Fibrobacteria bacterium]